MNDRTLTSNSYDLHHDHKSDQEPLSLQPGGARRCRCGLLWRAGTSISCLLLFLTATANTPQGKAGVDAGPQVLIDSGLLTQLSSELGYKLKGDDNVHLYPDLLVKSAEADPPFRNMKNPLSVSAVTRRIAEQTYEHSRAGRMTLTLGGDHSIAIGTIAGTAKATRERLGREIAVIWVDAHADINTPEASGSGNIHGMPVAFLTGIAKEEREEYFGWLKEDMRLNHRKLVYIGLRDVDVEEKKILREYGIKAFSMFDIDR